MAGATDPGEARPADGGGARQRLDDLEAALQKILLRLDGQGEVLDGHAASLVGYGAWLADLQKWMTATVQTVSATSSRPPTGSPELQRNDDAARFLDPTGRLERQVKIWTVMAFLAVAQVPEDLMISVIVPTKNRRRWLERAIASVCSQTYSNWELLVVDDASDDDTHEWLIQSDQPKLLALEGPGTGAGAARNVGLDAATGDLIAYLDDDNLMHPGWLKAVAWAFSRWTETESLYGARILEDDQTSPFAGGAFPSIEFPPYDREHLERASFIDQNVFAHRAGIPEARQDQSLSAAHDWDVALRVTARRAPLELPAVACVYRSMSPARLSQTTKSLKSTRAIRARVHTTRGLRLVVHGATLPVPEEKAQNELNTLRDSGALIAYSGDVQSTEASDHDGGSFAGLEEAVERFRPDLVVLMDQRTALDDVEVLGDLRTPFCWWTAASDDDPRVRSEILGHAMCAGVCTLDTPASYDGLSEMLTQWRLRRV